MAIPKSSGAGAEGIVQCDWDKMQIVIKLERWA